MGFPTNKKAFICVVFQLIQWKPPNY